MVFYPAGPYTYHNMIHSMILPMEIMLFWAYQTPIGGSWASDPNVVTHSQGSDSWSTYGWAIDLSDSATPSLGSNAKFAHMPLGSNAGEANIICVTTNGLIYFREDTSTACPGDADASSDGGGWNGFAMGATVQGEQQGLEGMLWLIRDIAPDPDLTAPVIDHVAMGDSHALDRKVSAVIYDPGYEPSGLDVSVGSGGPTLHYEIFPTSGAPTGTMTQIPMIPDGSLSDCELQSCTWSADIPTLSNTRDESVTYYITAQDNSQAGVNSVQTTTATFKSALPQNTLVLEWRDIASDITGLNTCTFQTVFMM